MKVPQTLLLHHLSTQKIRLADFLFLPLLLFSFLLAVSEPGHRKSEQRDGTADSRVTGLMSSPGKGSAAEGR